MLNPDLAQLFKYRSFAFFSGSRFTGMVANQMLMVAVGWQILSVLSAQAG